MDKDNKETQEETNLLIHDKSSKVGAIYFIGLNSKIYAGKLILKKNVVTDKVIRQTVLSENLSIIESGGFNMKQTAILIKGFTVFLHRQVEVLISDLQILYRKYFLNNETDIKNIIKKIRKRKNNNIMKKKFLTLQDVNANTNDNFLKISNNFDRHKNAERIENLLLKKNHDLYLDYNFENLDTFNRQNEEKGYSNIFDNMSSLNYSKLDNLFTLNNTSSNFFSKELSRDMQNGNNMNDINNISLKLFGRTFDTTGKLFNSLDNGKRQKTQNDSSNLLHISFFTDQKKKKKHTEYNWADIGRINDAYRTNNLSGNLNYSFSQYMSGRALKNTNELLNNRGARKVNEKKKAVLEIDQKITLKEDVWEDLKKTKKEKRKFTDQLWEEHFIHDNKTLYYFNKDNKKTKSDCSLFYKFYEITKNYNSLDTRKDLFKLMQKLIDSEIENNKDKAYHHGVKRKLYYNAMYTNSSLSTKNDFYFEQMRDNFTENHFMNIDNEQRNKKRRFEQDYFFNDSSIDQKERNINCDFYNSISDSQYERRDQMKLDEDDHRKYGNPNFSVDATISPFKNNSKNSTLLDSMKESVSVPSSKLMNRRSSTSSSMHKYDPSLLKLKTYIEKFCISEKVPLEFETICPVTKINYKNASITFYNLLVLASNEDIELTQKIPGKKIFIKSC